MWLFAEFRMAFPDWREEIVELVAEDDTVAGRFRCSGTHRGEFLVHDQATFSVTDRCS
jgi:predicted ester cyclase